MRRSKPGPPRRNSGHITGRLQHRGSFAFLLSPNPGEKDLFIQGASLRLAMDGDIVEARIAGRARGRPSGEILRVVKPARSTFTGTLRRERGSWYLDDAQNFSRLSIDSFAKNLRPKIGDVAVARIVRRPSVQQSAAGEVTEILGAPDTPGVRFQALSRQRELPRSFPKGVARELKKFPEQVSKTLWKGRRTVFDIPHFTIDGADAKDFDDAVSLEVLKGGGQRLGVHIADVSHYVKPGTELDTEARDRATSVYLPGTVIPMLPHKLSDGLCSLVPNEPRLAFTCWIDLDTQGKVKKARFEETVIKSWRRFTYEEVEDLLCGRRVGNVTEPVREAVLGLGKLQKLLLELRLRRGAIDFELPEFRVEADAKGVPTAVTRRERLQSHRLIEECMILANEAAARELISLKRKGPHRVHELPDPAKLAVLAADLRKLGLALPKGVLKAQDLPKLLKRAAAHPLHDVFAVMTLRSMKQAQYTARHGIHFGLASKAYTHFTSPIRRYPDLLVHRALKSGLQESALESLCQHCSDQERRAADAERQATALLRIQLIAKNPLRTYRGVVTRVDRIGSFVELAANGAFGLLRGTGMQLGQTVEVQVASVNLDKREIELKLSEKSSGVGRSVRRRMHREGKRSEEREARRAAKKSRHKK